MTALTPYPGYGFVAPASAAPPGNVPDGGVIALSSYDFVALASAAPPGNVPDAAQTPYQATVL